MLTGGGAGTVIGLGIPRGGTTGTEMGAGGTGMCIEYVEVVGITGRLLLVAVVVSGLVRCPAKTGGESVRGWHCWGSSGGSDSSSRFAPGSGGGELQVTSIHKPPVPSEIMEIRKKMYFIFIYCITGIF